MLIQSEKEIKLLGLIDEANNLSHKMDMILPYDDPGPCGEVLSSYSLWKIDCYPLFFEGETKETCHIAYPEYYAIFAQSDGVPNNADCIYTNGFHYQKKVRLMLMDKDGRCRIDENYIPQMKLAKIGLEKRVNALTAFLKELKDKKPGLYIRKQNGVYEYLGVALDLSQDTDWFKVFDELYLLAKEGGRVEYADLAKEIKKRIPRVKNLTMDKMKKFIQRNLTDRSNGFIYYAKIRQVEQNGRRLLDMKGAVIFNNGTRI